MKLIVDFGELNLYIVIDAKGIPDAGSGCPFKLLLYRNGGG